MSETHRPAIGLDLGGTKILAIVVASDGTVLGRALHPTPREGRAALLDALERAVREAASVAGLALTDTAGVGVGVPGVTDADAGVLILPPNLPADCRGLPVRDLLHDRLGVPVRVDNDANVAAIGELHFGAGRGTTDMIYVTISTGIGGGVVVGGRIVRGAGLTAGEVGHMVLAADAPDRCGCGRTGCWEAISSGTALARQAAESIAAGRAAGLAARAASGAPIDARLVLEEAEAKDEAALVILDRAVRFNGVGFMNLIHILGPQAIVVGGGLTHAWERLIAPAADWALKHCMGVPGSVRIVRAELGELVGAIGAAALVTVAK